MKKLILIFTFISGVIASSNSLAQKDSTHIGFILANLYSERWHKDMSYFKEKANELGAKVTFIDCFDSEEEQANAARKLVQLDVDCIVFVPIAISDKSVVAIARQAAIPVISYDRFVNSEDLDLYISFDSEHVGEMMAKQVTERLPAGNILFVGGPSSDFNSALVRKGVFSVLKREREKYEIKKVNTSDWSELSAFMTVQKYLEETKFKPDAIICSSDLLTTGVMYVLEEMGLMGDVLLTGQDGNLNICRQIIKGNVLMTVYKSNRKLAYTAAEAAVDIAKEGSLNKVDAGNYFMKVPAILKSTTVLNKENIDQMMSMLNIYSKEELYGAE